MHRFLPLAPPKRAWLHPLTPLLYIFTHIGEVPSQSAFLKAEVQLPQPFLTRDMLQSFNHFCSSTGPSPGAPRLSRAAESRAGHNTADVASAGSHNTAPRDSCSAGWERGVGGSQDHGLCVPTGTCHLRMRASVPALRGVRRSLLLEVPDQSEEVSMCSTVFGAMAPR